MITEIPTAADFQAAGLNQLYLAWQIAIHAIEDYEQIDELDDHEADQAASAAYWAKSQPALANAFGLIQQGVEMALKGRIASISPFLLISRDPKDWPKGADTASVPFSEFRTLDAADLVKVHNTFSPVQLDAQFRSFWDAMRRERNKVMHSVSARSFYPATLVRILMTAAQALFGDIRWSKRLLAMEADGKYAAYGLGGSEQNMVMHQIETAIRYLKPAENKLFFGFDPNWRSYLCPNCYEHADRDWEEEWPKLAQFGSRSRGATELHCVVCDETTEVRRSPCTNAECRGDVVYEGKCLTCVWSQDNPHNFRSGLTVEQFQAGHRYWFRFSRESVEAIDAQNVLRDELAIEHARRAMAAPHLLGWSKVEISRDNGKRPYGQLLGTWIRSEDGLIWQERTESEEEDGVPPVQ